MRRLSLGGPFLLVLPFLLVSAAHAAHFPEPVPTTQTITLTATLTVDGSAVSEGDEVVAYSVHPVPGAPGTWEKTVVGLHVLGAGEQTINLPVYGDDPSTSSVTEGCTEGEEISLVLWRAAEGKEYPAYRTPAGSPVPVVWSLISPPGAVDIDFTGGERIPLRNAAWNLFSYGVLHGYQAQNRSVPTAAQLPGVAWDNVATLGDAFPLLSIAGKYDRLLGNDGTGSTFWNPTLPSISSMAYLAPGYGYWVKMKPSSVPLSWMTVPGTRTVGTESLLLNPGWTLAGYWGWPVYHVASYAPWDGLYPMDVYDNAVLPSIGDLWSSLGSDYVRMTSFDGGGAHLWNPSQPTFSTLKYLAPGYGYWVKMLSSGNLSFPPSLLNPTIPKGVIATGGDNQVTVSWNPVSGATSYNLYWATTPGLSMATGTRIAGVTSPHTHTGRTNGTTYYYVVTAVVGGVESAESVQVAATPAPPPFPTVTTLGATSIGVDNATVNGTVNPNGVPSTAYFEWGTDNLLVGASATTGQSIGAGNSNVAVTTVLTGLTDNTTYYYRVVGTNSVGTSKGGIGNFTTAPNKVTIAISSIFNGDSVIIFRNNIEVHNFYYLGPNGSLGSTSYFGPAGDYKVVRVAGTYIAAAVPLSVVDATGNNVFRISAGDQLNIQSFISGDVNGRMPYNTSGSGFTTLYQAPVNIGGAPAWTVTAIATDNTVPAPPSAVTVTYTQTENLVTYPDPSLGTVKGTMNGNLLYFYAYTNRAFTEQVVVNPAGTSFAGTVDVTWSPTQYIRGTITGTRAPSVQTLPYTTPDNDSFALHGTINPNGLSTTAYFEYGLDNQLASPATSSPQNIGAGTDNVPATATLSGLTNSTTYYYRVVGTNAAGTSRGEIGYFATIGSRPPSVQTLPYATPDNVSFTLNGTVNSNGVPSTAYFEWGTDNLLVGASATTGQSIGAGNSNVAVTTVLAGLTDNTTYYYRVVGTNSVGTSRGVIGSFRTAANKVTISGVSNSLYGWYYLFRDNILVSRYVNDGAWSFSGLPGDYKFILAEYPLYGANNLRSVVDTNNNNVFRLSTGAVLDIGAPSSWNAGWNARLITGTGYTSFYQAPVNAGGGPSWNSAFTVYASTNNNVPVDTVATDNSTVMTQNGFYISYPGTFVPTMKGTVNGDLVCFYAYGYSGGWIISYWENRVVNQTGTSFTGDGEETWGGTIYVRWTATGYR